jgi:hypothetical protein
MAEPATSPIYSLKSSELPISRGEATYLFYFEWPARLLANQLVVEAMHSVTVKNSPMGLERKQVDLLLN